MVNVFLKVVSAQQRMYVYVNDVLKHEYLISSAKNGMGEQINSYKTPRGWHEISAKIGDHMPVNTVFIARQPTGEIYSPELAAKFPNRDWMLTRILWLSGLEAYKNLYGNVDTKKRFIYIHGTPDTTNMSVPGSKGCIRMRNQDLLQLYDLVVVGTKVYIE